VRTSARFRVESTTESRRLAAAPTPRSNEHGYFQHHPGRFVREITHPPTFVCGPLCRFLLLFCGGLAIRGIKSAPLLLHIERVGQRATAVVLALRTMGLVGTRPFLDSHERRTMLGAVRRTLGFLFAFTISVTVLVGSSRVLAWLPVRQASGCCTGECAKKQAPQRAAKQDQPSTCSACCAGIAALFPLWQTEKFIDVRSSEHRWVTAQLSAPSREEKPPLPPPRV